MKTSGSTLSTQRYLRLPLVVAAIVSCFFVVQASARYGFSQLLMTYSLIVGNLPAAQKATQVAPTDAEAHLAGGALLSMSGLAEQGVIELERAVALRPTDYVLWSELGLLRDQAGDSAGALAAFDEAVKRAPFYSRPRWNRGNVLLRKGEYEAAFHDLNLAAQSNPELIPSLIDLAWGISRGDVKLTEQLAQINGDQMHIAFARFLARHGRANDAMSQFNEAGNVPDATKQELVEQLLGKGAFKEAFDVWKVSHGIGPAGNQGAAAIYDGGFEGELAFDQGGFSWRVPRALQAISLSLDSSHPHTGSKDLRIEFDGDSNPGAAPLSQLILVEPSKHYRINFAARSQDVVTGGVPFVNVSDAAGERKRLGQSRPLATGTSDWQVFSVEFTTTSATSAVGLSLQRENCTTSPCPIFGSVSLDSFSIEQLR